MLDVTIAGVGSFLCSPKINKRNSTNGLTRLALWCIILVEEVRDVLTSLGKFLRKLRIDRGEILKNMSDKLGVTVSFLSAVENGKKRMPSGWNNVICKIYQLDQDQRNAFTMAIAETEQNLELNFTDVNLPKRELAVSFARKFTELDNEQMEAIKKILMRGDDAV